MQAIHFYDKVALHSFLNLTLLLFCYPSLQYTLGLKGLAAFIGRWKVFCSIYFLVKGW